MPVVTDYTAILSGEYWNGIEVTGAPVIVTFSFPLSAPAYDISITNPGFTSETVASFTSFTTDEQAQAIQALNEWAAASGIVFVEVAPGQGDINFQNVDFSTFSGNTTGDVAGVGFYPFGSWDGNSFPNYYDDLTYSGDVFMNSQYQNVDGTVNYGTLLHEIGHAIGMKHPTQDVNNTSIGGLDHNQVLSSDDPSQTIMAETEDASSIHLHKLDKDAAAYIYGPAGTGGVYTTSASGADSVSSWSWNATTQTMTQTAVSVGETIRGTSVNDIIYGSSGDDRLFGLAGDDALYGYAGNDSLYGGSGNDTLVGGTGDDSYFVSSPTTTIIENAGEGYDTVYSYVNFTLPENVEVLYLYGAGLTGKGNDQGDTIFGDGTFANTLIGGTGDDYIVGGSGNDTIAGGGGADLMYGQGGADTFVFSALSDASVGAPPTIGDFTEGVDKVDLSGIAAAYHESLTFIGSDPFSNQPGQVHEYFSGSDTIIEGDVDGDGQPDFQIQLYGNITLQANDFEMVACYCRGTLIRTEHGEVAVETLAIGDRVVTASGAIRPIKWMGKRSYSGRFVLGRKDILPICIKAGALERNIPRRDLWISPHHAMYLNGILIESQDLINGKSIVQAEQVEQVEYFHIELESHDVILAEGAPSETFIDDDSRGMFHNAHEYYALYPNDDGGPARYCAPRHQDGYLVEAVRRRIAQRAGLRSGTISQLQVGPLRGYVDVVNARRIAGWAQNEDHPEAPVCLDIYADDRLVGQVLANSYRADLMEAGLGSGRHSFEFKLPLGAVINCDSVKVRRSLDGTVLARCQSRESRCRIRRSAA